MASPPGALRRNGEQHQTKTYLPSWDVPHRWNDKTKKHEKFGC
ncbi:predicted protein [Sclerotinia sclerotiorum 1980 UF-70]|uniref:Uncharacterized protein n=1 Tax=Sclerotinia sclerotiorum (strain ATCC 18683 / 1980 / Ss-1) TaxID=665079 RepID=A7E8I4_SCLS1|nr:predicted protein [Sclerotinia sclerotiorum 1980 UF-70]EDN96686.1 predicted protein [Sclerotinia sclerotiorum 1980 UF-70]